MPYLHRDRKYLLGAFALCAGVLFFVHSTERVGVATAAGDTRVNFNFHVLPNDQGDRNIYELSETAHRNDAMDPNRNPFPNWNPFAAVVVAGRQHRLTNSTSQAEVKSLMHMHKQQSSQVKANDPVALSEYNRKIVEKYTLNPKIYQMSLNHKRRRRHSNKRVIEAIKKDGRLPTDLLYRGPRRKLVMIDEFASIVPRNVLEDSFGFDLCQKNSTIETCNYDMVYGGGNANWVLNNKINSRFPLDTLNSMRTFGPFFGLRHAFCSKIALCEILTKVSPGSCFPLKHGVESVEAYMQNNSNLSLWVLKRDGPGMHLHSGRGVWFLKNMTSIRNEIVSWNSSTGFDEAMVQPYLKPYTSQPPFNRKVEIRFSIAITSLVPPRFYVHNDPVIIPAIGVYNLSSDDQCVHDTHLLVACKENKTMFAKDENDMDASYSFAMYAKKTGWGDNQQRLFLQRAKDILGSVMYDSKALKGLAENGYNKKMRRLRAQNVVYIRADFGITDGLIPTLYEINNWPYLDLLPGSLVYKVNFESFLELFQMIGLDVPENYRTVKSQQFYGKERMAWELGQTESWEFLDNPKR